MKNTIPSHYKRALLVATALMLAQSSHSYALDKLATPAGENVVAGAATFDRPQDGTLNVNQSTGRAVIDWDSFDIGKDAVTTFAQPDASSLAVNRVTRAGADPTQILGRLESNGRLMVLDRNGVLIGRDAVINVAGIVASTGRVTNANAMDVNAPLRIRDAHTGMIENRGTITVDDAGLAAFVAPTVKNSGVINAKFGKVAMGASSKATVDFAGDGLISFAVNGDLEKALAENRGKILAEGGEVMVTARAAKDVLDSSINMKGIVDVSSVTQQGGKIILAGASDTTVNGRLLANSEAGGGSISVDSADIAIGRGGRLDASSTFTGTGGKVMLKADNSIDAAGRINAGGEEGGGTVRIAAGDNATVAGRVDARGTGIGEGGLIHISSGGDETRVSGTLNAGGIDGAGRIRVESANLLTLTEQSKLRNEALSTGTGGRIALAGGGMALDGRILFSGQEGGGRVNVTSTGDIDSTGSLTGLGRTIGEGGSVNIASAGGTTLGGRVNVGGASGGGRIGIDADTIAVSDLRANATRSEFPDIQDPANGGRITLTGANGIGLDGRIAARGGAYGGDGGTVTFSQAGTLSPTSTVDVSAPMGTAGSFLP